jgi:hypothetical protein
MSSIGSLSGAQTSALHKLPPPPAPKPANSDGDNDNDATESATAKAAETASSRQLDVTA